MFDQPLTDIFRAGASDGPCRKLLYPLFWTTLVVLLLLYASRPILDPDFWWHLKTGELMLQQHGLLAGDPFNFTGDGIVRDSQAVLLYGYWLWETVTSLLYRTLGFPGIFLLKVVTLALLSWAVLFEMSRQQLSQFTRIVLTGLGALLVINVYHLERPQVFSFLFMTLLLGMIARLRQGERPSRLLFPLMILWANIHGGFVIGDILLLLAVAGFLIQYRHERGRLVSLSLWALGGILASFVNPAGWTAFLKLYQFMSSSVGPEHVLEYRSSLQLYLLQSKVAAASLWGIAALHLIGLSLVSRRYWPEIFVSLFIIAFGLAFIRNTGFVAVSLLPMTGWYLEQACAGLDGRLCRHPRAVSCALLVAIIAWLALGEWQEHRTTHGPIANKFPHNMATFLKSSGLSGRLFNDYNAGGYLDWALYPQWQTFIDGRELDARVSHQYLQIAAGSTKLTNGRPYYALMLDRYRIDVVALRLALPDGRLQPLLKLLLLDPQWVPVFLDDQSFVLVRNTPGNAAAISRHALDKPFFLDMLTRLVAGYVNRSPRATPLTVLYADTLSYTGRKAEAAAVVRQLEQNNLNPDARAYLNGCLNSCPPGCCR